MLKLLYLRQSVSDPLVIDICPSEGARNFEQSLGQGGSSQVVSVLDFDSDDPSSNPADAYRFSCKICVWKDQK